MSRKETFASRQRFNAEQIKFMDALLVPLIPLTLAVLLLYPLGVLTSARFDVTSYIIYNLFFLSVWTIRMYQRIKHMAPTMLSEALVLGLIVMGGATMLVSMLTFQHPIIIFWLIVIIMAYLSFAMAGYFIISFITVVVAALDALIHCLLIGRFDINYITLSLIYVVTLNVVAFVLIKVLGLTTQSERRLAQSQVREIKQRSRLQTVINNLAEGLIAVNSKGVINLQNGTALSVLDTNHNLVGKRLDEVLNLRDVNNQPFKAHKLLASIHEVVYRDDLKHQLTPDDAVNLGILVTPIRTEFKSGHKKGQEDGFVIILRDITKQKSLDEERDEFISVISHELRTPVAVAEGSVDNLVLFLERGADREKIKGIAETAHEQIIFLASMLNDLGTLSRAERGVGDTMENININELCQGLYDKYLGQAATHGLEMKLDMTPDLPIVSQSRLYLEETLQNFLNNAIKYTKTGSVTLEAHLVPAGIECAVSDTGIGISSSDQKKVFEKFYRSEDYRTRETGGTGLGLYVVKKLVDKMGVKMDMQSQLNKGSRFSITLALSKKAKD